jgi:hypothetical protein
MHLDFMRDSSAFFPKISNRDDIRTLRIWHCKYKSMREIANLPNLEVLVIASFPETSFDVLANLTKLQYLSVLHMPKVSNLRALAGLRNVESLSLSTSPAWDAAKRCTIVESLEPIVSMGEIKHLELFGVCPPDRSLAVLTQCKNLQSARFSHYSESEVEKFYREAGVSNVFNPKPSFDDQSAL